MSQIVLYFSHSSLVLSFYIDVVLKRLSKFSVNVVLHTVFVPWNPESIGAVELKTARLSLATLLELDRFSMKSVLWSFGILLWNMTHTKPHYLYNGSSYIDKIMFLYWNATSWWVCVENWVMNISCNCQHKILCSAQITRLSLWSML